MNKIPLNREQDPMQSPFAELQLPGLPEQPAAQSEDPKPGKDTTPHRLCLRREKARRGGKTVVVVSGFPTAEPLESLDHIVKAGRKSLGCGGSRHEREIEFQGDQSDRVREFLHQLGYSTVGP